MEVKKHESHEEFSVEREVEEATKKLDKMSDEELRKLEEPHDLRGEYALIEKFEKLREKGLQSDHKKKESFVEFINIVQFVRLSILDLRLVLNRLELGKEEELEQRLWYRVAAMMIYEVIEDFAELLGKKGRVAVGNLTDNDSVILAEFGKAHKNITDLKKEEMTGRMRDIRVISIAHKDQDSRKIIETMQKISAKEIITLLAYLNAWHRQFEKLLERIVTKFK